MVASRNWLIALVVLDCSALFVDAELLGNSTPARKAYMLSFVSRFTTSASSSGSPSVLASYSILPFTILPVEVGMLESSTTAVITGSTPASSGSVVSVSYDPVISFSQILSFGHYSTLSSSLVTSHVSMNVTASLVPVSKPTSTINKWPGSGHGPVVVHPHMPWCLFGQGEEYRGFIEHCGLDFHLGDSYSYPADHYDECMDQCAVDSGCVAFVYKAHMVDGRKGKCYLKSEITHRQRPKRSVLGGYKLSAAANFTSPPCPEWWCPTGDATSIWSSLASKSVPVTTTYSPTATSSWRSSFSASYRTVSPSLVRTFSLVTSVAKTSSYKSNSLATVHSLSTPSSGRPLPYRESTSSGSTSVGPPFWFSSAHPCYPTDCSFPVTATPWSPSSEAALSRSKATVTKSVTTKIFSSEWYSKPSSSKVKATETFAKTKITTYTRYLEPSRTKSASYVVPSSTTPAYSSPLAVTSGYVPHPSSRWSSTILRPSSSSKGYVVPSPESSVYWPPTRPSSSSKDYAAPMVSPALQKSLPVTGIYEPSTYVPETITIYKPVPHKSSVTPVYTPGMLTYSTVTVPDPIVTQVLR